jgi:aspartate aminotransferase-like enzyme
MTVAPSAFLNIPSYPTDRYALVADRLKALLFTRNHVLPIQAEALLALEAAATSIARPGLSAVNVVTSPYGAYFGAWLRRGGTDVVDVTAEPGQPIGIDAVRQAVGASRRLDIVAMVHGEAANGALNPIAEIMAMARGRGALTVVDAVASFGAHPLAVDALGLDIVAIGPQKALGGPAGLSALCVSDKAWEHIAKGGAPSPSMLSLQDLKQNWIDAGRGMLPGTPSPVEFWALDATLDRVEGEGIGRLVSRHQQAMRATRAGLRALGVVPWIKDDACASALVTSAPVPAGIEADAVIAAAATYGVTLGRGFGDIADRLVRLDHTGARAAFAPVLANVVAYGAALDALGIVVDMGKAAEAVTGEYATAAG